MSINLSAAQTFDGFPSGVYICDADGKITYFNQKAVELCGRTPVLNSDQELFCPCHKVFTLDGQFIPRNQVPMVDALKSGSTIKNVKAVVERPDGSKIVVQVCISPIKDGNGVAVGAINIFADISAAHNLETHLQSINRDLKWTTEELEQMIYCVSHDLREPLRVASTYIQLLSQKYDDKLDDKARNYISNAVKSCDRVRHLINDLLTFSRVRGEYSSFQAVDLNKVISQALLSLKLIIEERHAIITTEALPKVFGDEAKLSLVFQNLIGNAIKFSKDQPKILIFLKTEEASLTIGIKDNGIGIDENSKHRVFEISQRLHPATEYKGTGMGLAICKKIVEQHDGKIWFQSEKNKGTIFYFTLGIRPHMPYDKKFDGVLSNGSGMKPLRAKSEASHVVQVYHTPE